MRTRIDIEPDVLNAAKEIARQRHVSVGRVVSMLMREALTGGGRESIDSPSDVTVAGFEPFPERGVAVTNELLDALNDFDEESIAAMEAGRREQPPAQDRDEL